MRCRYCHNPDTWKPNTGLIRSPESLIQEYKRNREFYRNGGITVTGGEPLLQIDFLLELFGLAKKEKIHVCLDTSGITYRPGETAYNRKLEELLDMTDLVMLDLKHMDPQGHKDLTGQDNAGIFAFAKLLNEKKVPVWIRHVVVPGITDDEKQLTQLGEFIAGMSNVQALDILPYHCMGVSKYQELGIPYSLEGVPAATKQQAMEAKKVILNAFHTVRQQKKSL